MKHWYIVLPLIIFVVGISPGLEVKGSFLPVSVVAYSHPLLNQEAPELSEKVWINSRPLKLTQLRGKVVIIEFWTYG